MVDKWKTTTIGECVEIVSGGTPSTIVPEFWDGDILWCTPTDITRAKNKYLSKTERNITSKGLHESAAVILPSGTILLCSRATIGDMCIAAKPISTNQGFKNLICNDNVNNEFLYYLLHTKINDMLDLAIGSTFLEISKKALMSIEIKLPSLPEQRLIATALSDIDNLITSLEKLIAKKRDIKKGIMQELLTGKRRLLGFDDGWIRKTLVDIFDVLKGFGLSKEKLKHNGKQRCILYGELFTRYSHIANNVYSSTNFNEGLPSKIGDILMPSSTTTSGEDLAIATAIMLEDVLLGGDIVVYRAKSKINTQFFAYLIPLLKNSILQYTQGITIVHLQSKELLNIEVIIPSTIEEQSAIVQIFIDMDAEIDTLTEKLTKLNKIKQGMMSDLLTGKIRLIKENIDNGKD